jgi:glycosyltransferase involved in cell wall biosynthesis
MASATIDIAAALGAVGARALVACQGGPMTGELQAKGGIFLPFPSRTKNPLAMALNMRRLARLIEAEGVDIVHVRSRALAWVAYGATRLTKTPFVTGFQGSYKGGNPITLRYNSVLARGDIVIAESSYMAGVIGKLYPSAKGKIRIIHQGTNCRIFAPNAVVPARVQDIRRQWKVAPHERIILLASRVSSGSGHKILIEAARRLSENGLTGVKFILAGDAEDRGALHNDIDKTIAKAGLQGIMHRAGRCDMPAALLAASIVVVPSTDAKAFGQVVVEAQAMGTPVIAANLGAAPELVLAPPAVEESQRTGWLTPPGDASALTATIITVLSLGASAAHKLSSRAMEHVEARFSVERMCAGTLETYADLQTGEDG